jgi:hypothetical protein
MLGFEPRVADRAQRHEVVGVVWTALAARNDVMRGQIARRAVFAAGSVPGGKRPTTPVDDHVAVVSRVTMIRHTGRGGRGR